MQDQENAIPTIRKQTPWNKGKLTGAKPPLRPKHVWSIRTKLQIEGRVRDLAMFNLAIDSKLRGCDVVAIKGDDVAAGGYTADRATVRQKKTGRPVRFELTEQTRQAVDEYLRATNKKPGEFLFSGRRGPQKSITTRQYARAPGIGLDRQRRAGSEAIWDAFTATHQGDPHLSAHGKSQGGPASARAHQDRKHRQISGHRGR
jgi:integrase